MNLKGPMNLKGLQGNPWMLQSTLAIKLPVGRATAVPHEHGVQRSQRFLVHPLQSFVADACVMVLTHVMVLKLMRWSRRVPGHTLVVVARTRIKALKQASAGTRAA